MALDGPSKLQSSSAVPELLPLGVRLPLMAAAGKPGTPRRLTKPEADLLAGQIIEALQESNISGSPSSPEEVAVLVHAGLSFLGNDLLPIATENTPPFFRKLFHPLIDPERDENAIRASLKIYSQDLANPPKTAKGLHNLFVRICSNARPEEIIALRKLVQELKAIKPLEIRDQLIGTLRKSVKGTPGPKTAISREERALVAEASDKLRPVFRKIFDLSKESTQPLPEVVKAVSTLQPEWKIECDFLLAKMDLVIRSMKLSKIRRAKAKGKASKLADALACEFAGFHAGPSYSMQILEQARRSQKSQICP